LRSVVVFGTADVNVMLVLTSLEQSAADTVREAARVAQVAIHLRPMFLLESEIDAAVQAFALKLPDVLRRRRVLYGEDPFARVSVARQERLSQLKQQLVNLNIRLRASYIARSLREEQVVLAIADAAGPLRSCAAALMELEGRPAGSPKQALERVAAALGEPGWQESLSLLSSARDRRSVPASAAAETLFRLMELARRMRLRAESL
jgi:hypothetical protein